MKHEKKPLLKIIRDKCLDCTCNQITEVRECPVNSCPLWPYRMGDNPFNKRELSDEEREERRERLRKNRQVGSNFRDKDLQESERGAVRVLESAEGNGSCL
jgi:hypothetical protein